jgi:hypothetical protein
MLQARIESFLFGALRIYGKRPIYIQSSRSFASQQLPADSAAAASAHSREDCTWVAKNLFLQCVGPVKAVVLFYILRIGVLRTTFQAFFLALMCQCGGVWAVHLCVDKNRTL